MFATSHRVILAGFARHSVRGMPDDFVHRREHFAITVLDEGIVLADVTTRQTHTHYNFIETLRRGRQQGPWGARFLWLDPADVEFSTASGRSLLAHRDGFLARNTMLPTIFARYTQKVLALGSSVDRTARRALVYDILDMLFFHEQVISGDYGFVDTARVKALTEVAVASNEGARSVLSEELSRVRLLVDGAGLPDLPSNEMVGAAVDAMRSEAAHAMPVQGARLIIPPLREADDDAHGK